jgi:hypothetical protein
MLTYPVLNLIETSLDAVVDAHIVPETKAYPTSGSTFIRVTGDYTDIQMREDSVRFIVGFSVLCSIRTRDFMIQNKRIPYEALLSLQEQCFFHILQDSTLFTGLYALTENISVTGRFSSTNLNTRVQAVWPDFFNSNDTSSQRESGYMLSQAYTSPELIVPFSCMIFPPPLAPEM